MRIHGIRARGIGRFHGELTIPITELGDAKLVAVIGNNGEGKTTAIELVPAAIYRSMPSRGSLAKMSRGKDSFIELDVETTRRATMRLMIDGVSKPAKSEGIITSDGEAIAAGKLGDYDKAAASLFPGQDLFFASAFAAQGGGGAFLSLKPAARKEMFVRMLGAARLQELSDAASVKVQATELELAKLRGEIAAMERAAGDLADLEAQLQEAKDRAAEASELATAGKRDAEEFERARVEWVNIESRLTSEIGIAAKSASDARQQLTEKRARAKTAADDCLKLQSRINALAGRLEEKDALEVIAMEVPGIEEDIAACEQEKTRDAARVSAEKDANAAWERRRADVAAHGAELKTKLATIAGKLATVKAWLEDAAGAANTLDAIPCHGGGIYAGCHLIGAAVKKRDASPGKTQEAAILGSEKAEIEDEIVAAREEYKRVSAEEPKTTQVAQDHDAAISRHRARLAKARDAETKLAALAETEKEKTGRDAELAGAEARVQSAEAELAMQLSVMEQADRSLAETRRALEAHKSNAITGGVSEQQLRALMERERAALDAVARCEQSIENARKSEAMATEARRSLDAVVSDIDDWAHLRDAFGKNGIQALEIDAAGPEVSGLTNELLHACFGSRFTVALETQAMKADGKDMKEIFDLRVIDSQEGVEGSAGDLSGGEKVIVAEALSLAIAVYNCERSSVPLKTLFRDECSGALSNENAVRYIEMLRRGIELGGFERCFFVAHQQELWELADKRLVFEDGGCFVV